jgi:predicted amidophosphoribosyltransferase
MAQGIIALLFPPQCASCAEVGSGLCVRCAPPDAEPIVRRLATLHVTALGEYRDAYRRAVLAMKDGRRDVVATLGERLSLVLPHGALLVPVRTTAARRRTRGIDGVEAMTRRAASFAHASVACALERLGSDAQQGRSREGRLAARGRFRCDAALIADRDVMLVDDVCTTGATLEDCADSIRRAGGRVARAVCVAIAENGRKP